VAKKPTKTDIYEKYNLNETDKKVLNYKTRFESITHQEIADILHLTRSHVTEILNKPVVKHFLKELEGNWIEILINAKEKAAKKLIKHVDSSNPAISIRACEQLLQLDKTELGNDKPARSPY